MKKLLVQPVYAEAVHVYHLSMESCPCVCITCLWKAVHVSISPVYGKLSMCLYHLSMESCQCVYITCPWIAVHVSISPVYAEDCEILEEVYV